MADRTAAKRQRALRERMKAKGWVARRVHIRPEYSALLLKVEKAMRLKGSTVTIRTTGEETMANQWTTASLAEALQGSELAQNKAISVELLEGSEPIINVIMHEYGDLPIQVSVSGEQIFASATLWSADQVKDRAAFNEAALFIGPVSPLSSIGLVRNEDGQDIYICYGQLSSRSPLAAVEEELDVLAVNTIDAAESFSDFLAD